MPHYAVTVRAQVEVRKQRVRGVYGTVIVAVDRTAKNPLPQELAKTMAETLVHDQLTLAGMHGSVVGLETVNVIQLDDAECVHENLTRHKLRVTHVKEYT